ncbi:pentapeptide repeat-containing protein [Streptosporangium sp. NPDC006930]|uniref:pentapeptide repeat-containing protein n=1 Tax=unclassified Streptosporangium TaxID=2632669 RepID=UPI00344852A3
MKAVPGQGLRLARIGPVLAFALTGSILLSAGLFVGALGLLGFPALTPVGQQGLPLSRLLDLLKLSFAVVAGIGGVIALVVAYRKQKVTEAAEHRQQTAELRADEAHRREATKLFNERFATAANHLGHDSPAVRLAGVHTLAGLADDAPTSELRQTMIDVLCAYLRMPYAPDPGDDGDPAQRLAFAGLREVRHTIIRVIGAHLRENAAISWQGHDFDFTAVVFDGGDFSRAVFSGGRVAFNSATFASGTVAFSNAMFSGGAVFFHGAVFSGGRVLFENATFSGGIVLFSEAVFSGGRVLFENATFSGGRVAFSAATFSSGTVSFSKATFSGGTVAFEFAEFSGGTVAFSSAKFISGMVTFMAARFSGSEAVFREAEFSGGTVAFSSAKFISGMVTFSSAKFISDTVTFFAAVFAGGTVDLRGVDYWSPPPTLEDPLPPGVLLPDRSDVDPEEDAATT